jgi:hypothetical protein
VRRLLRLRLRLRLRRRRRRLGGRRAVASSQAQLAVDELFLNVCRGVVERIPIQMQGWLPVRGGGLVTSLASS